MSELDPPPIGKKFLRIATGPLQQYVDREGHALVPQHHVEEYDGEKINLGTWVNARRSQRRKGNLPAVQADFLESVPGWKWRVGSGRGNRQPTKKFSESDIADIVALHKDGTPLKEIADAFGVRVTRIQNVLAKELDEFPPSKVSQKSLPSQALPKRRLPDTKTVAELLSGGHTEREVAEELGISEERVRRIAHRVEVKANLKTRREQILMFAAEGFNGQEIGEKVGLSRERVRQIIVSEFPGGAVAHKQAVKDRRLRLREENKEQKRLEALDELCTSLGDRDIDPKRVLHVLERDGVFWKVAQRFNVEAQEVKSLWILSDRPFSLAENQNLEKANQRFSDEQIATYLQLAFQELGQDHMSHASYAAFAPNQRLTPEKWPSVPRILQRFGSWVQACEFAGVQAGEPRRGGYTELWPVPVCMQFVKRFIREQTENGGRKTFREFSLWLRENNGPSEATVRNKLGGWTEMKHEAERALHQEGHGF